MSESTLDSPSDVEEVVQIAISSLFLKNLIQSTILFTKIGDGIDLSLLVPH